MLKSITKYAIEKVATHIRVIRHDIIIIIITIISRVVNGTETNEFMP